MTTCGPPHPDGDCPPRADTGAPQAAAAVDATRTTALDFEPESDVFALPPDHFPGYRLVRRVGHGGQGVVYEAIQEHTNRRVAIKALVGEVSAPARRRFEREIALIAQLRHPNIIAIFHSGVAAGPQFYVMDYVDGLPLHRYARQHALSLERVVELIAVVCDAVQCAHAQGIVHRDLKPSNILVDEAGQPRVLDFGLAKEISAAAEPLSLTRDVLGTLPYMSPEQARGSPDAIDQRSDVYALGVVLYELLTGGFPYPVRGTVCEVLRQIQELPPTPLAITWASGGGIARATRHDVRAGHCPLDRDIETIVLKCLAKEPPDRYQNAGAVAEDLRRYLAGEPIRARRTLLMAQAWSRVRRGVRRHPVLGWTWGVVAILLLANYAVVPCVYEWTPLDRFYQRTVAVRAQPSLARPIEFVRLVELRDEPDVALLAQELQVSGVDPAVPQSLRLLHGAMLERMADSGVRTLVLMIRFRADSPYDAPLVAALAGLRERGVEVVMDTGEWGTDATGLPLAAPGLLPYLRWGPATGQYSDDPTWFVDLAADANCTMPAPSLALAAVAAYRCPGAEPFFALDAGRGLVTVQYRKPAPRSAHAWQWLALRDEVWCTGAYTSREADVGLQPNDVVAQYAFFVPGAAELTRVTTSYAQVLRADAAQRRAWFADRLVIVADARQDVKRFPTRDGRALTQADAQAAVIESLLRAEPIREPHLRESIIAMLAGVALGLLATRTLYPRRLWWAAGLACGAGVLLLAAVGAYRYLALLCNPALSWFTLFATAGLTAFIRHQVRLARS